MAGMLKNAGRSAATIVGRRAVRSIRALGAPLVNIALDRRRRHLGLARPIDRPALAAELRGRAALEIGPFFTPLLTGDNVAYFDVLDQAALRERAGRVGGIPDGVPSIEFVSPTGDLTVIDRTFDVVLSAHVVEHQPDLVKHLADVAAILRPGGEYWLVVPDRRFSFDYPFAESTLAAVKQAHADRRRRHSASDIRVHLTQTAHNNALFHWLGWHGEAARAPDYREFAERELARAGRGEYVDVHAWIFTPHSFKQIMSGLHRDGLTAFRVDRVTDTAFGKLEFFAKLVLA